MLAYPYNPSIWEAESGGLSIWGQPGLQSETVRGKAPKSHLICKLLHLLVVFSVRVLAKPSLKPRGRAPQHASLIWTHAQKAPTPHEAQLQLLQQVAHSWKESQEGSRAEPGEPQQSLAHGKRHTVFNPDFHLSSLGEPTFHCTSSVNYILAHPQQATLALITRSKSVFTTKIHVLHFTS